MVPLGREVGTRGSDSQSGWLFSYVKLEERVLKRHPLRKIKGVVDAALVDLDAGFAPLYAVDGRPSIAPERLLQGGLSDLSVGFSSHKESCVERELEIGGKRKRVRQINYAKLRECSLVTRGSNPASKISKSESEIVRELIDDAFDPIRKALQPVDTVAEIQRIVRELRGR